MQTTRRSATAISGGAKFGEEYLHFAINSYLLVKLKMHDDLTYLGMDVGTSDLRKLLISGAGKPIGATEACYGTQNLYPGWSEQDPDKWIVALNSNTHELKLKHAKFPPLIA